MKLTDYIKEYHYNNQARFAATQGTTPQQVTQWINKGFIVVNGYLYSPRRELKRTINNEVFCKVTKQDKPNNKIK